MPDTPDMSEEFKAARSSFVVHSSDVRLGPDLLFHDWYRLKKAAALCTVDPLAGVTFAVALEAVIASRISGEPLVLPEPRKSQGGK